MLTWDKIEKIKSFDYKAQIEKPYSHWARYKIDPSEEFELVEVVPLGLGIDEELNVILGCLYLKDDIEKEAIINFPVSMI